MMRGDQTMIAAGRGQRSAHHVPVGLIDQGGRRVVLVRIQRRDVPVSYLQSVHWQASLHHRRKHIVVTGQTEQRRVSVAPHGGSESLIHFRQRRMREIATGDDGIGLVGCYRMFKNRFQSRLGIYAKQGVAGSNKVTI